MERTGQTTDLTGLISSAKSGQAGAVEQLVDLYAPRLYGLLYRMTGSSSDTEDLLQETYIKMLRGLGHYQENGRFEPWLFSIAANLARDWLRRQRRAVMVSGAGMADRTKNDVELAALEIDAQVSGKMVLAEQADQLQRALASLSVAEREVVTLRFFSDLSFKEIAAALQIPLGTALARGHRALKHLREELPHDEADS